MFLHLSLSALQMSDYVPAHLHKLTNSAQLHQWLVKMVQKMNDFRLRYC